MMISKICDAGSSVTHVQTSLTYGMKFPGLITCPKMSQDVARVRPRT